MDKGPCPGGPSSLPGVTSAEGGIGRSGRPGRQAPLDPASLSRPSGGGRAWTELPTLRCASVLHHVAVNALLLGKGLPRRSPAYKGSTERPWALRCSEGLTRVVCEQGEKKPSLQAGLTLNVCELGQVGSFPGMG